jgi:hypothetical protein
MADPVSPNMGLTLPQPGSTTGGSPTYTYATEITADLSLIDTHNHTTGNGVQVPTAGLNINADLTFGGFSATNVNNITASGAVTLSGSGTALSITNNATVSGTLTVGTLSLGSLTLTGAGTALTVNNNATITGSLTLGFIQGNLNLAGAGALLQSTASTSVVIKGNAAATGGVGSILDNQVTQTGGIITSFRTNGTEEANIDFAGNLNLTNGGAVIQGKTATSLTLKGKAAATGVGVILDNSVVLTGAGLCLSVRNSGTEVFNIDKLGILNIIGTIAVASSATEFTLQSAYSGGSGALLINAAGLVSGTAIHTIFQTAGATKLQVLANGAVLAGNDVLSGNHVRSNGPNPTVTTAVGSATAAVVGTDLSGILTITTTSSTPTINQALFTVTLGTAFAAGGKYAVVCYPATNGAATFALNPYVTSVTNASWVLAAGSSVAMGTGAQSWYYQILGNN